MKADQERGRRKIDIYRLSISQFVQFSKNLPGTTTEGDLTLQITDGLVII